MRAPTCRQALNLGTGYKMMVMTDLSPGQFRDSDAINQAETDIRHLKNTIVALREELENTTYGNQEIVQSAVQ